MNPDKFVKSLTATGTQLEPYMKAVIRFLHRDTAEISVLVVVNWFLDGNMQKQR